MFAKTVKRFAKLNAGILAGGIAFTFYQYPDLRGNPYQVSLAMLRGARCGITGILMAKDYLTEDIITHYTHKRAAKRLYNCFAAN